MKPCSAVAGGMPWLGVSPAYSPPTRNSARKCSLTGSLALPPTAQVGTSTMTFLGDVAYERITPAAGTGTSGVYKLVSGGYDLTLSGIDLSTASGCRMTGSGHIPFLVGQSTMNVSDGAAPYTYAWEALTAVPPAPTGSIIGRRTNCPPGSEGFEGTTFQINLFAPIRATGPTSADGITYQGTVSDTVMTTSWRFTGTP